MRHSARHSARAPPSAASGACPAGGGVVVEEEEEEEKERAGNEVSACVFLAAVGIIGSRRAPSTATE